MITLKQLQAYIKQDAKLTVNIHGPINIINIIGSYDDIMVVLQDSEKWYVTDIYRLTDNDAHIRVRRVSDWEKSYFGNYVKDKNIRLTTLLEDIGSYFNDDDILSINIVDGNTTMTEVGYFNDVMNDILQFSQKCFVVRDFCINQQHDGFIVLTATHDSLFNYDYEKLIGGVM